MNKKKNEIFKIDSEDSNQRIDNFLSNVYLDLSRSYIQKQIKAGKVLLNGTEVKVSCVLKTDDTIHVDFDAETVLAIEAENIPLKILYEDEEMAVVVKPCPMLTHPTSSEKKGTLVNSLLYHFGDKLCDCNGELRPGIVHRLDRNTSGLLMIAKTNSAFEALKGQMQARTVEKKYYAVVCGDLTKDSGTISSNIGRHPSKPEKMAVTVDGKPSVTHYKVIERFGTHTFIEVNLETGRTHQIRVHMASVNHPIVNDTLYGGSKLPVKTFDQVLQAYSLKFVSPFNQQQQHISIEPDDDIIKILNYLRSKK